MNIEELCFLALWAEEEIKKRNIPQLYQALLQKLRQNVQPNQPKVPFEQERNQLITVLKEIETKLSLLNESQKDFFKKLGILELIGKKGADHIENILYKNVLDIATAANKINESLQTLNKGLQKLEQAKSAICEYVTIEPKLTDKVLIRVYFEHEASINNIVDLKEWSNIWYEICRGLSIANNEAPENIEVVGAARGSLIIELATSYMVAKILSKILLAILEVVEKILLLKHKLEEIRSLQLMNDTLQTLLKEFDKKSQEIIENETENILQELETSLNFEGGEVKNNLRMAIKRLIDFIKRGGKVDCSIPEDQIEEDIDDKKELKQELKERFQEIRSISKNIEMLEE